MAKPCSFNTFGKIGEPMEERRRMISSSIFAVCTSSLARPSLVNVSGQRSTGYPKDFSVSPVAEPITANLQFFRPSSDFPCSFICRKKVFTPLELVNTSQEVFPFACSGSKSMVRSVTTDRDTQWVLAPSFSMAVSCFEATSFVPVIPITAPFRESLLSLFSLLSIFSLLVLFSLLSVVSSTCLAHQVRSSAVTSPTIMIAGDCTPASSTACTMPDNVERTCAGWAELPPDRTAAGVSGLFPAAISRAAILGSCFNPIRNTRVPSSFARWSKSFGRKSSVSDVWAVTM